MWRDSSMNCFRTHITFKLLARALISWISKDEGTLDQKQKVSVILEKDTHRLHKTMLYIWLGSIECLQIHIVLFSKKKCLVGIVLGVIPAQATSVLPAGLWVFSRYSYFLLQSKDMQVSWWFLRWMWMFVWHYVWWNGVPSAGTSSSYIWTNTDIIWMYMIIFQDLLNKVLISFRI